MRLARRSILRVVLDCSIGETNALKPTQFVSLVRYLFPLFVGMFQFGQHQSLLFSADLQSNQNNP